MLHIDRIVLREIRLQLKEPFRISSGVVQERRILLLELHDGNGTSEWAECVAGEWPNYSPETIDTAWFAIREWLAPRLVGKPFGSPEAVHQVLGQNVSGHNMAKAALEMGCHGLAARQNGVALAKSIGGQRTRVPTGISIGIQKNPEALVERALRARADGYRKIKVKIQPGADVEYVRAVRDALPADTHLMADANSAYSLDDADHIASLDQFGLIMIEQPLHRDDLVRHAQLQRRVRTPICLDESITDVERCEDMITLGSGRIVNIKPGRVGGFSVSRRIHDVCAKNDIPVWCGGMLESGVGRAYNVALASLPNFSLPGDLSPSARYWERDIVTPEWTMDGEGMVPVPFDRAGIGVAVDRDRVEDLTVRREELKPTTA
ncbi:MAG TPA: o-succinylbenzoate synthase [Gemmatimonadaceae bacterium]|nr:o-succinylbenzoate synthase [Gemmatimonadaceae bacterium]